MRKSIHSFPRMTWRERFLMLAWETYALGLVVIVAYLVVKGSA